MIKGSSEGVNFGEVNHPKLEEGSEE
jgi:hypothetical protein